jgi:hypothetical protein
MSVPIFVGSSNLPFDPGQALEPPTRLAHLIFRDDQSLNGLHHGVSRQAVLRPVTVDFPHALI